MTVKPVGTQPVQVCFAPAYGRTPVPQLLANLDLATIIRFSDSPAIGATDDEIPPLGTIGIDGKRDIWAATLAGTANLQVTPHATQWTASPAQIAAQIAAAGVSLLASPTVLTSQQNQTIASTATATLGPFPVTQTGYEIGLALAIPAAATLAQVEVTLSWTDSASGQIVEQEEWILAPSSAAGGQKYTGTGPTNGDTLTITITNADNVQTLTYSLVITQNSRLYASHDWRQATFGAVPGFTNGSYLPQANVLFASAPAVAGNTVATRVMALYAGEVWLSLTNGANAGSFNIAFLGTGLAPVIQTIFNVNLNANGTFQGKVTLPRAVCTMGFANNAAGTNNMTAIAVISEQRP